ncbi:MAG: dockerin type I domain-containing protein [Planctomycetota bacterium]
MRQPARGNATRDRRRKRLAARIEHLEQRRLLAADECGVIDVDTTWDTDRQLTCDVQIRNGATLTIDSGATVSTTSPNFELIVADDGSMAELVADDVTFLAEIFINETAGGQITNSNFARFVSIDGDSAAIPRLSLSGNTFNETPRVHPEFVSSLSTNTFGATDRVFIRGVVDTDTTLPVLPGATEYRLDGDLQVQAGSTLTIADSLTLSTNSTLNELLVGNDGSEASLIANDVGFLTEVFFSANAEGTVTNSQFASFVSVSGDSSSTLNLTSNTFDSSPSVHAEFASMLVSNTFGATDRVFIRGVVDTDTTLPVLPGATEYRLDGDVQDQQGSTLTIADSLTLTTESTLNELFVANDGSAASLVAHFVVFSVETFLETNSSGLLTNNTFNSVLRLNGAVDLRCNQFGASSQTQVSSDYRGHAIYNDFAAIGTDDLQAFGDASQTIDLTENWWGTTLPTEIEEKILDNRKDANRPLVDYDPALTAPPLVPDYVPTALTLPQGPIVAGSLLEVAYSVRNDSLFGDADNQSFALFFLENGSTNDAVLLGADSVEPLNADSETGLRSVSLDLPGRDHPVWSSGFPASYSIRILVDATDSVFEYDDRNNELTTSDQFIDSALIVDLTQFSTTQFSLVSADGNVLLRDAGTNGTLVEQPLSQTNSVILSGSDATAEDVSISFADSGLFQIQDGIQFDAGSGDGDQLSIVANQATTSGTYFSEGNGLGDGRLEVADSGQLGSVNFTGVDPLRVEGLERIDFVNESAFNVDDMFQLIDVGLVNLPATTTLNGSIESTIGTVNLGDSETLTGQGSVDARFVGSATSQLSATGSLTLGDSSTAQGFFTAGDLNVGPHDVTLRSASRAALGVLTQLGSSSVPGSLISASGFDVAQGNSIGGYGTLRSGDSTTVSVLNGAVSGTNTAEPITLENGVFKGIGDLANVVIGSGAEHQPGLSPARVTTENLQYGSGSSLQMEIGGVTPGAPAIGNDNGYDQIHDRGTITLGGTLDVVGINQENFSFEIGQTFVLIQADVGVSGSFETVNLPTAIPSNSEWELVVDTVANEVRLLLVQRPAEIVARNTFYGGSSFDQTDISASIATDKRALLPGETSTFANYTNYNEGLNGLVLDISYLPPGTTAEEIMDRFEFATWDGIDAAGFTPLASSATIQLETLGASDTTRVVIQFGNGQITNTWLRTTVKAGPTTGLLEDDVFYFGNVIGDTGFGNTSTRIRVNAIDTALVRSNQSIAPGSAGVDNIYDMNRDGRVNAIDTALLRFNQDLSGSVAPITAPTAD